MEDLHFLFVDDLMEQDRDEINRILFGTYADRKSTVEFLLTLEARRMSLNEAAGNQYADNVIQKTPGSQSMANFNVLGSPCFRNAIVNVRIPPPPLNVQSFVHDGSTRNGALLHQIQTSLLPGQQAYPQLYYPLPYQGRLVLAPYFGPLQSNPFAVPTTAGPTSPPPHYFATVSVPGQAAAAMTSPPCSNLQMPCQTRVVNDGAGDQSVTIPDSSCNAQVPNVAPTGSDLRPGSPVSACNMEANIEINGDQTEGSVPRPTLTNVRLNHSSENFSDSSAIDVCSCTVDQAEGQHDLADDREMREKIEVQLDANHGETTVSAPRDVEDSSASAQTATEETQTVTQKAEAPQPAKEEPKSWASLFRNTRTANEAIVTTVFDEPFYDALDEDAAVQMAIHESTRASANLDGDSGKKSESEHQLSIADIWVPADRDPPARSLADKLKNYTLVNRGPTYSLRGITNRGNWCYMNATLQALMACPTFFQFLRHVLGQARQRLPSSTPLLDACAKLASELTLVKDLGKAPKNAKAQTPLDLSFMHSIICQLKNDSAFKGRQEDAEEFLLFVLNRLHEELVAVLSLLDKDKTGERRRTTSRNDSSDATGSVGNEWHHVGAGKKITVTRHIKVAQSPILDIFAGQLRYGLSRPGAKESANLEPFFTLPLDVLMDGVKDIKTALKALTGNEILKNFQGNGKTEADATRRVTFYELPPVLIFQLKYFEYTAEGVKKNIKQIDYAVDLTIGSEFLSHPTPLSLSDRQYKLFAVVFHHGEKAEGGHYTVDLFHAGRWFDVDDTKAMAVEPEHVLSFQPPRVPYLLFYRHVERTNLDQQAAASFRCRR